MGFDTTGPLTLSRDCPNHNHTEIQSDEAHTYASCSMNWNGVSVLDHAILAQLAYFNAENNETETEGLKQALAFAFPEGTFNVSLDVDFLDDTAGHPVRKKSREDGLF